MRASFYYFIIYYTALKHSIKFCAARLCKKPPQSQGKLQKSPENRQKSVDLPPRLCYSMHYLSDERCFFRAHFLPEDALRSIQGGNARLRG